MNLDLETAVALGWARIDPYELAWLARDWAGRKIDRPRAPRADHCEVCGKALEGRQRAVCGIRCKHKAKRRRRAKRRRASPAEPGTENRPPLPSRGEPKKRISVLFFFFNDFNGFQVYFLGFARLARPCQTPLASEFPSNIMKLQVFSIPCQVKRVFQTYPIGYSIPLPLYCFYCFTWISK